jgi:2-hydroxy-3-keto-5-methylthiopentenyl-1-phosphate phosphatase
MLYVIDFDGTLAVRDTTDALLEAFADPAWKLIEAQWLAGEITAVECMRQQVRMVRADRFTIESFFRATELDQSFLPFYRYVSAFAEVAIVSDGLDRSAHVAIRHARFPPVPVYANRLLFVPEGIDISYPYLNSQCVAGNGVCKCEVARRLTHVHGGPLVLVGDGKSDACLAHRADVVFAKAALRQYCEREGIEYTPFASFADVLTAVQSWPAHRAKDPVAID